MSVFQKRDFKLFEKAAFHFAKLWNIKESPIFENDSENIVYRFENTQLILRLTENSHRTRTQIHQELSFIKSLNKQISQVVKAVPSQVGSYVLTENFGGQPIHATVFQKAPGQWIEGTSQLKDSLSTQLGEITSKIHLFGKRVNTNRSEYIESDHLKNHSKYLKEKSALIECEAALDWYNSLPKDKEGFGPIHGDIHYGNFFYTKSKDITLFDFDDFSNGFYIFDIGIHLYYALGMFTHYGELNHYENYKKKYLRGYKSYNDLDPKWFSYIDEVIRFRTIDLYTWMNKMYQLSDLTPKQESMFRTYIKRIEKSVESPYKKF
jgi:Ser/Thr protein kinase RdoA (MazF antagonist)